MTDKLRDAAQAESSIIRQNKLLADALAACILASGIVRKDVDGLTGPQLLLFAEDLREMLATQSAQQDAQTNHCPTCKRTDGDMCDWCPSMQQDAQAVLQGAALAGWLREWEGDDSDLGQWLFAATEEEKDDSPNWRPVYWLNAAPTPPAQQEWIDDAGRLQWALWRIKDLERQLAGRPAVITPPEQS